MPRAQISIYYESLLVSQCFHSSGQAVSDDVQGVQISEVLGLLEGAFPSEGPREVPGPSVVNEWKGPKAKIKNTIARRKRGSTEATVSIVGCFIIGLVFRLLRHGVGFPA